MIIAGGGGEREEKVNLQSSENKLKRNKDINRN